MINNWKMFRCSKCKNFAIDTSLVGFEKIKTKRSVMRRGKNGAEIGKLSGGKKKE